MGEGSFSLTRFDDSSSQRLDLNNLIFEGIRAIGEYRVSEILGEGAYSNVSKVRDTIKNKHFAMKTFKKHGGDAKIEANILREITILKNLRHENVIRSHDFAIGPGGHDIALIMDLCTHTLYDQIRRYPRDGMIPTRQLKCIMKHLFGGLRYLHKNYIIHRDLNPSNCFVSQDGILKIGDFGLSRRCTTGQLNTRPMTPGTVTRWYRPPEVLLESPYHGMEVDLWSAGCIVGELLKLDTLFKGESDIHQISLLIETLGTPTQSMWPDMKYCQVPKSIGLKMVSHNRLEQQFKKYQGLAVLEILSGLLAYDPKKRLTADACYEHDWMVQAPFPDVKILKP